MPVGPKRSNDCFYYQHGEPSTRCLDLFGCWAHTAVYKPHSCSNRFRQGTKRWNSDSKSSTNGTGGACRWSVAVCTYLTDVAVFSNPKRSSSWSNFQPANLHLNWHVCALKCTQTFVAFRLKSCGISYRKICLSVSPQEHWHGSRQTIPWDNFWSSDVLSMERVQSFHWSTTQSSLKYLLLVCHFEA